ncbi:MAG: cob(I)yrinic acid a,c-diamide adenosyltransferase [Verrucomicrobia bacterium]|nr:cob(I)yrinic acid a,c-diamide adenosyltransferase [Verrucomicrobiota bacterium]
MSIATKTGDDGTTALLFGKRVPKTHPRIVTNGAIDELGAALGLCRAFTHQENVRPSLLQIQKELIHFMGELACENSHQERYLKKYADQAIQPVLVERLTNAIQTIEGQGGSFTGWRHPGESPAEACFDSARTLCRRAERALIALRESGATVRDVLIQYLNRLSDLLWLWSREENPPKSEAVQ